MVFSVKTITRNALSAKFDRMHSLEYFGTRLLVLVCRSQSTCSTSSGGSSNTFGQTKSGGKSSAVWERMAVAVKYSEKETNNTYINTIRATHDPALELKTVEEELKGTIGKALGRQGHKILHAKQLMEKELQRYNALMESHLSQENSKHKADILTSARNYNEYRKLALQARWELTVQRQAAGFIVNNHNYVTEQYPIAAALPVHSENDVAAGNTMDSTSTEGASSSQGKEQKAKFTDQLQWWERVGRWR
jgi:hypothetical protein